MSEEVGNIHYNLGMKIKDFVSKMKEAQGGLSGMTDQMEKTGKKLTTRVTLPLIGMGTVAVREAALSAGAMDKFRVVFGEFSDDMESFVDDLRTRMALPRREIIALSSGLQDMLIPMGFAREEAMGMSQEMLELANQLAVFNDASPKEVLDAMTSGLSGQMQPLKRFGVQLSVTALEQIAWNNGLLETGRRLSDVDFELQNQIKAQAMLIGMTEQSGDAIAGYEDNVDSAITRMQDLLATFQDLTGELGKVMLPILDDILKNHILPLVKGFRGLDDQTKKNIVVVALLVAVIGPLLLGLGLVIKSIGTAIVVVKALGVALAFLMANPISLLVLAVVGLAIIIAKNWDTIKAAFEAGRDTITRIVTAIINTFSPVPAAIARALSSVPEVIKRPFREAFDWISEQVGRIRERLEGLNPLKRMSPSLVDQVSRGISALQAEFERLDAINIQPINHAMDLDSMMSPMQGQQNYNIHIDRVNDIQDAQMISRELGFRTSVNPRII